MRSVFSIPQDLPQKAAERVAESSRNDEAARGRHARAGPAASAPACRPALGAAHVRQPCRRNCNWAVARARIASPHACTGAARAGCSLRFTENFTRRRERRHAVAAPDRPTTAGRRYVVCTRCSPAMRGPRQALPCARGWCVARLLPRAPATLSNGPSSAARASVGLSSVDSLTRRPMSSFPSRTYPCPFSGA